MLQTPVASVSECHMTATDTWAVDRTAPVSRSDARRMRLHRERAQLHTAITGAII